MAKGRPTKFTQELANRICVELMGGKTLREICRGEDMPHRDTIHSWLVDAKHKDFSDQYARAREIGYLEMADELLEVADDGSNDWITRQGQNGQEIEVADHEHISRSKLRVDTRKWLLSKCLPKIYGDKVALTGAEGGPITFEKIEVEIVGSPRSRS